MSCCPFKVSFFHDEKRQLHFLPLHFRAFWDVKSAVLLKALVLRAGTETTRCRSAPACGLLQQNPSLSFHWCTSSIPRWERRGRRGDNRAWGKQVSTRSRQAHCALSSRRDQRSVSRGHCISLQSRSKMSFRFPARTWDTALLSFQLYSELGRTQPHIHFWPSSPVTVPDSWWGPLCPDGIRQPQGQPPAPSTK